MGGPRDSEPLDATRSRYSTVAAGLAVLASTDGFLVANAPTRLGWEDSRCLFNRGVSAATVG